jgi:hypothetical protein
MRTGGMVFLNWIDCFTTLPFLSPPPSYFSVIAGPEGAKNLAGEKVLRLIQIRLNV